MNQSIKVFTLSLGVLLSPASAMATDSLYFAPYIGAGFGQFQLGSNAQASTVPGGYVLLGAEVNPYFAPEIRIGKTGKASSSSFSSMQMDWFAAYLLRLQAPVADETMLYGLIGGTTLKSSLTPLAGTRVDSTTTAISFGLGLDYRMLDKLSVSVDVVRYARSYKEITNKGINLTGLTGQVRYNF